MSEAPPRRITRRFTRFMAELGSDSRYSEPESELELPPDEEVSLSSSSVSPSAFRREVHRQTGINLDEERQHIKSPGKAKKEIFFTEAMRKTRQIQKKHPGRFLCGGLALNLYGIIKRDKFSDLDFVTPEWRVIEGEVISMVSNYPYKHCLFLSADVKQGETIQGIRLQDLKQILYWKKRYGRDKDNEDLKEYLAKQFLKEEDFNL